LERIPRSLLAQVSARREDSHWEPIRSFAHSRYRHSPVSPSSYSSQVAIEYKRDSAASALAFLAEGHRFLKTVAPANGGSGLSSPAAPDDASRLRAAARAGSAAAAAILLRRNPLLARSTAVVEAPHGALVAAARGGHAGVVAQLVRCGAAEISAPAGAPTALQAALGAGHAEVASLLHGVHAALDILRLGSEVPSAAVRAEPERADADRPERVDGTPLTCLDRGWSRRVDTGGAASPAGILYAMAADCKVSRSRLVLMDAWEPLLAFSHGAPGLEAALFR